MMPQEHHSTASRQNCGNDEKQPRRPQRYLTESTEPTSLTKRHAFASGMRERTAGTAGRFANLSRNVRRSGMMRCALCNYNHSNLTH
jgi:hypothetical protein